METITAHIPQHGYYPAESVQGYPIPPPPPPLQAAAPTLEEGVCSSNAVGSSESPICSDCFLHARGEMVAGTWKLPHLKETLSSTTSSSTCFITRTEIWGPISFSSCFQSQRPSLLRHLCRIAKTVITVQKNKQVSLSKVDRWPKTNLHLLSLDKGHDFPWAEKQN